MPFQGIIIDKSVVAYDTFKFFNGTFLVMVHDMNYLYKFKAITTLTKFFTIYNIKITVIFELFMFSFTFYSFKI